MPLYEYRCDDCGTRFEENRHITDAAVPPCHGCGSSHVTRLVSLSSFVLKGSGWYRSGTSQAGPAGDKEPGKDAAAEGRKSKEGTAHSCAAAG